MSPAFRKTGKEPGAFSYLHLITAHAGLQLQIGICVQGIVLDDITGLNGLHQRRSDRTA